MTPRTATVLVVDDEPNAVDIEAEILRKAGYEALEATSVTEGMKLLDKHFVDLMLLDEKIGPLGRGTAMLADCRKRHPGLGGILITGHADLGLAIQAMRAGAIDLLPKPVNRETLVEAVNRGLVESELAREARWRRWEASNRGGLSGLVGDSQSLREALELAKHAAPTDAPVLILGESGTGKEMFARAIHSLSPRQNNRFVTVNMASIPEELRVSELFGHRRGSFTGAVSDQVGQFQAADGGTLFLDEIGEASAAVQASLLRVLQERELVRVGDTKPIQVDVRVVAATNLDLGKAIEEGKFREDLYYRLAIITLSLPPLRARMSDIPALAAGMVTKHAVRERKAVEHISPEAMEMLSEHLWPGNVRELDNVLRRAVILASGNTITADLLDFKLGKDGGKLKEMFSGTFRDGRGQFEREYFRRLLDRSGNDKTKAAASGGIDRSTLYEHLERLGLSRSKRG